LFYLSNAFRARWDFIRDNKIITEHLFNRQKLRWGNDRQSQFPFT